MQNLERTKLIIIGAFILLGIMVYNLTSQTEFDACYGKCIRTDYDGQVCVNICGGNK